MALRGILMRLLQRCWPARDSGARTAAQHSDEQLRQQSAQAIAYFLGLPESAAGELAQTSLEQRQALRAPWPAAGAPDPFVQQALAGIDTALARGSCLLALPFSVPAVQLLRRLALDPRLPLLIVESPALHAVLPELGFAGPQPARCATQHIVRHVKTVIASGQQPTLYVSFPELHAFSQGTAASIAFLGKQCRLSLLESLLYTVGLPTMLTMNAVAEGPLTRLSLVALSAKQHRDGPPGQSIGATFGWLTGHLQANARLLPAQTLSWQQLYRTSEHYQAIERHNQIKQLDAYFDAWKSADAGLDNDAYRLAVARLAALRQA